MKMKQNALHLKVVCLWETKGMTWKHISTVTSTRKKLIIKQNSKTEVHVIATEGAWSFHAVKHHLPYRSKDFSSKLNQVIYSDSGIVEKVSGARAKTETIVNRFLVPEVFCLGVSTDSNNHE